MSAWSPLFLDNFPASEKARVIDALNALPSAVGGYIRSLTDAETGIIRIGFDTIANLRKQPKPTQERMIPWIAYYDVKNKTIAITEWRKSSDLTPEMLTHEFIHAANQILQHERFQRYVELLDAAKRHGELVVRALERRNPRFSKDVLKRYSEKAGVNIEAAHARYMFVQGELVALRDDIEKIASSLPADVFVGGLRSNLQYLGLAAHWHITNGDRNVFGYPPEELSRPWS